MLLLRDASFSYRPSPRASAGYFSACCLAVCRPLSSLGRSGMRRRTCGLTCLCGVRAWKNVGVGESKGNALGLEEERRQRRQEVIHDERVVMMNDLKRRH